MIKIGLKALIKFFEFQKERARRKEIEYSTISNYYKALKLFVEMNFDNPVVNWKRISKGIPSDRKSANDRAPTREELKKLSDSRSEDKTHYLSDGFKWHKVRGI